MGEGGRENEGPCQPPAEWVLLRKCFRCCWSLMTLLSHLFHTPDWLSLVWWLLLWVPHLFEANLDLGGERLHSSQCWGVRMGRPYTDPCQDQETLNSGPWDHWWLCFQQLVKHFSQMRALNLACGTRVSLSRPGKLRWIYDVMASFSPVDTWPGVCCAPIRRFSGNSMEVLF